MQILISVAYYLPGYKSGGPIRSIANLVERFGDEFQFKIVTADRDFRDTKPYLGIKVDHWNKVGKEEVFYMSPKRRSLGDFKKILCSSDYDVIYLNGFFSPHFTIKPLLLRRLCLIPDKPLNIAPRGVFSPGALGLKRLKKRMYLMAAKAVGLYRGVVWQASSEVERADIRRWFGRDARVIIAPNLPALINVGDRLKGEKVKVKRCLNIIFLSRISRMKNLDGALKILKGLKGKIEFNIYGPMEDKSYWGECQKVISSLPKNIDVRYYGTVEHDQVNAVIRDHDLFFLPTLGENFGHVILEALCAGCPVLISDQTPWRDLEEKGIGWDLPLSRPEMFQEVLQRCVDMRSEEYMKWSERALKYGLEILENDEAIELNRQMFYKVAQM